MAIDQTFRGADERKIFLSMTDDERRGQRETLTPEKFRGLQSANAQERARYLENEALGQEEVWAAFENGFLTGWEDQEFGRLVTPIWPHKEFVENFAASQGCDWAAVPIPVTAWIDIVTPDLLDEDRVVALFPINGMETILAEPGEMLNNWEISWKRYLKYQHKFGDKIIRETFGFE